MATALSTVSTGEGNNGGQYKATELWQKIVEEFRSGMPVGKHRIRMKLLERTFTGSEAIDWLTTYLQSSGMFQTISKGQVVTLLQKFLESDVIEDARGKESVKFNDGSHLYQFVTKPGPLNFLQDHTPKRCPHVTNVTTPYSTMLEPQNESCDTQQPTIETPFEVECHKIWKDLTLARLLTILPSLETVPSVEGSTVANNARSRDHSPIGDNDIPSWIIMAFKCLSKWPDDSCDDVTGGLPIYHGFEQDVFQSVSNYFTRQPHPLIPYELYDLHLSIYPLIQSNCDKTATDALQLSSLLIESSNRIKLHRLLRFIHKTAKNSQLQLSQRIGNKEFMIERFSLSILRPSTKSVISSDQRIKINQIITHMIDHYHNIFRIPTDLVHEINTHLTHLKEVRTVPQYCHRVSTQQYEQEKRTTAHDHLIQLLHSIIHDENMSSKVKKHRLKQFKQSYPDIYSQELPPVHRQRSSSLSSRRSRADKDEHRTSNYF